MNEEEEREVSSPRKVEVLAQWSSEVSKGHDADLGRSTPPLPRLACGLAERCSPPCGSRATRQGWRANGGTL